MKLSRYSFNIELAAGDIDTAFHFRNAIASYVNSRNELATVGKLNIEYTKPIEPIVNAVAPMHYGEFCTQYISERAKSGDTTLYTDLTNAYAVYCVNPAGHWLHKE